MVPIGGWICFQATVVTFTFPTELHDSVSERTQGGLNKDGASLSVAASEKNKHR